MNTRELVPHIMRTKGLDTGAKVLAKSVGSQLIDALRMQARRKAIELAGKRHGAFGGHRRRGYGFPKAETFD
jgi:hypothetical protein